MGLAEKIAAEKARLAKQQASRGSFEKIDWFKPEMGDTMIRILPGKDKKEEYQPFHTVKIHYIGKELDSGKTIKIPARCREDFGEDCPVCEGAAKAMKAKNKELYNELRAKETHLYNILDYKARAVKPWAAGATVHTAVIENAGDIVEIFDLEGGRDWKVVKSQNPKKKGNLGIEYSMRPAPKDSDVPEKYMPLIDEALDLKTLYTEDMTDDMEAFIDTLDFDSAEEDDEPIDKSRFKKSVKSLKSRDEDEEEEEEDDIPENRLSSKAKAAAAAAKAKSKARDEEEEEEDEEEEEIRPKSKAKSKARDEEEEEEDEEEEVRPKSKAKSKKADIDFGDDEDLEKEMNSLMKKNKKVDDDE